MNKQRPVFLNLMQIRLPLPGLVSILHRISGLLVFVLLPFLLWLLQASLQSETSFNALHDGFHHSLFCRFLLWIVLSALLYHLIAGVRHLLMDMGKGESLPVARASARFVLVLSVIVAFLLGIWLW